MGRVVEAEKGRERKRKREGGRGEERREIEAGHEHVERGGKGIGNIWKE